MNHVTILLLLLPLCLTQTVQDYTEKIKSLTTANLEETVLGQGEGVVSFIMFSAGWCGHCRHFLGDGYGKFISAVEEASDLPFEVRYYNHKLDDSENTRDYFDRFRINGFPSFIAIRGDQFYRHMGKRSPETLLQFLRELQGGLPFPQPVSILDQVKDAFHVIKADIMMEIRDNPTRTYAILFVILCMMIATPIVTFMCMRAIDDSCKGRRARPVEEEEEPNPIGGEDLSKKER